MAAVILTDKCNLSCPACFRARDGRPGSKPWLFSELEVCLDELLAAGQSFVCYTGGEPSLWRDDNMGLSRLLVATSQRGLSAMFVTNGRPFRGYDNASAFLDQYFELTEAPLQTVVSIDRWHEGSWVEGRSPALEAILRWREVNGGSARLDVEVASLWCLDDIWSIPPQQFSKYAEAGIKIGYCPLSPLGAGRALQRIAPSFCIEGRCKAGLGSYGDLLRMKMGLSREDWEALDNSALLGPCMAIDTLTLDLDRKYWLCNDRAGESLYVASAGNLNLQRIAACLESNPFVDLFRRTGFADALRQCERGRGPLPSDMTRTVMKKCHYYGISGRASCGLCRALPREMFH